MKMIKQIDGYKTHLSAFATGFIALAYIFEHITTEQFTALITLAGAFGLSSMRDALKKIEK